MKCARVSVACALALLLALPAGALCAQAKPDDEAPDAPKTFVKDGVLDVQAVVDHFDNLYRADSTIAEARLIVTRPRRTNTMDLKMWSRGKDKALIVVQAPPREKGTATLKVERNLWNYLPRIKRTIRIPPSMMLASWMGSDFTNDDLVKDSSYAEDYEHELVGRSEEPDGWTIAFIARPDVVGLWNRFELVVSPDGTVPLQARYYDRKDRLARTMTWTELKMIDDRQVPTHLTLTPVDKEDHKTEMIYLDIDFDAEVPESTFSLSELERKR